MRIKNDISSVSDIEMEEGETLNIRLGSKNAITIARGEDKGKIYLHLLEEALLTDGGTALVRDAGKIRRFAQITFDLKEKE